jgi:hypothetical protein
MSIGAAPNMPLQYCPNKQGSSANTANGCKEKTGLNHNQGNCLVKFFTDYNHYEDPYTKFMVCLICFTELQIRKDLTLHLLLIDYDSDLTKIGLARYILEQIKKPTEKEQRYLNTSRCERRQTSH